VHSHAPETSFSAWDKFSSRVGKMFESERSRPMTEALVLIFTIFVIYFVIYAPWKQNKDLLEVLKLNNEGKVEDIKTYAKPLSDGMGFSESLEHISQTAIAFSANPNVSVELKQQLFDTVDKNFLKFIDRVPEDTRYRLFYGIFLSRFGWYGRAVEQLKEAQKYSPKKQQVYFELVNNLLLDNRPTEAMQAAKTAYELEPSYEEARFVYGLTAIATGNQALSQEILGGMSQSKIILDDRYLSILLGLKQYEKIIEVVKKRIELDPNNLQHRITLTAAYLEAGRREEAVQTLEEIIRLKPDFKEQGEYYINEIKAGRNP